MWRIGLLFFVLSSQAGRAQDLAGFFAMPDSLFRKADSVSPCSPVLNSAWLSPPIIRQQLPHVSRAGTHPCKQVIPSLAAPVLLLGFGFLTLDNPEFLESNEVIQKLVQGHYAGFQTNLDNYTRYGPMAAVYGLNLSGVKGKSDLVSLTIIFALSNFINNSITKNLKVITRERRPDYPSYDAFPSGHTSTAFTYAAVMHQEYKHRSAWYGVAGYSFAVATGTLRIANNRHWFSDVVAGAGVGILSARLVYAVYPWLKQNLNRMPFAKTKIVAVPVYQDGFYGFRIGLPIGASGKGR